MERSDIPYALMTLVFAVAIFMAGRMSAPERTTVIRETVQAAPSIIVVPSAAPQAIAPTSAEPPIRLAVLDEAPSVAPAPSVRPSAQPQVPVVAPKTAPSVSPKVVTPVPSVPVVLEETPEDVRNPYAR